MLIVKRPWVIRSLQIAFALSVFFLLFTHIDFQKVVISLGLVDVRYVLLIFGFYFIIRYVLAYQMSFGLAPLDMKFSTFDLFRFIVIASFYSLILPGDLVAGGATWYKLSRSDNKGIEAGALITYFRLVNTLMLVAVGLLSMWADVTLDSEVLKGIVAATFVGLIICSIPLFSKRALTLIEHMGRRWRQRLPVPSRLASKIQTAWKTVHAFQSLSTSRALLIILTLGLVTQVLQTVNYYFYAMSLSLHISLFALTWIRTIVTILQMIPISFAGLGVREVSLIALLQQYGISRAEALSLALVMFAMKVVTGLVAGIFEGWDILSRHRVTGDNVTTHSELEQSHL